MIKAPFINVVSVIIVNVLVILNTFSLWSQLSTTEKNEIKPGWHLFGHS